MPSIIKVDQIQSDQGFVNVSSNLQFSSGFTMLSPTIATPTFTGQATIPTIDLTGGQIKFPATQVPSSDANTLDDYEEGTWTPTFSFSGGAGTLTYSSQFGHYRKIGGMVEVNALIVVGAKGTASGDMSVTLPFSHLTNSYTAAALTWNAITYSASSYIISAQAGAGNAVLNFYNEPSGSLKTGLTASQCGSSFEIIFGICYPTT